MKQIILVCLVAVILKPAYSQISVGPLAGVHLTKYVLTLEDPTDPEPKWGYTANWHVGAMANVPLSSHFHLQPAFALASHYVYRAKNVPKDKRVTPYSLELPVNITYKLAENGGLLISAGPFGGCQLRTYPTKFVNTSIPLLKRGYLGLNAVVGYEFGNGIFLRAHYQQVLTDLYSKKPLGLTYIIINPDVLKSSSFGIAAGYLIQKHPKKPKIASAPES